MKPPPSVQTTPYNAPEADAQHHLSTTTVTATASEVMGSLFLRAGVYQN